MPNKRFGPKIIAECSGCAFQEVKAFRDLSLGDDTIGAARWCHASGKRREITEGLQSLKTPDWCPLLAEALQGYADQRLAGGSLKAGGRRRPLTHQDRGPGFTHIDSPDCGGGNQVKGTE